MKAWTLFRLKNSVYKKTRRRRGREIKLRVSSVPGKWQKKRALYKKNHLLVRDVSNCRQRNKKVLKQREFYRIIFLKTGIFYRFFGLGLLRCLSERNTNVERKNEGCSVSCWKTGKLRHLIHLLPRDGNNRERKKYRIDPTKDERLRWNRTQTESVASDVSFFILSA